MPFILMGANTAMQTITVTVMPATNFVIVGEDPDFEITTQPLSGNSQRTFQLYTGISYSYSCCDKCTKKIIAQLDYNMPAGLILRVYMAPPEKGETTGFQDLSVIEKDLVINIKGDSEEKNATLIYELEYPENLGVLPSFSINVIYTFMDQ